jgi:hypothetical protein
LWSAALAPEGGRIIYDDDDDDDDDVALNWMLRFALPSPFIIYLLEIAWWQPPNDVVGGGKRRRRRSTQ